MMPPLIDGARALDRERDRAASLSRSNSTLLRPGTGPRPPAGSEGRRSPMRAYELMVILDGDLDESAAQAWVKTVTDQVAARGGKIHGRADWWGKRRFAYEIKQKAEGSSAVFNLVAEPGALDDFERSLRLADDFAFSPRPAADRARHKLMRLPDAEAARRGLAEAASPA